MNLEAEVALGGENALVGIQVTEVVVSALARGLVEHCITQVRGGIAVHARRRTCWGLLTVELGCWVTRTTNLRLVLLGIFRDVTSSMVGGMS